MFMPVIAQTVACFSFSFVVEVYNKSTSNEMKRRLSRLTCKTTTLEIDLRVWI